jgi:Rieske Fe-S protein
VTNTQNRPAGGTEDDTAQVARRVVLRGAMAFGLLGATGVSLGACGDDSTSAAGAGADAGTPTPARTIRPGGGKQPTSKSDLYQRGPEPRPTPSNAPDARAPEASPASVPQSGPAADTPAVGSRSDGDLTTARREGQVPARPAPTPAPLPPGAFARTSEIPVGGGKTFQDQKIVVTQPAAGQFHGFSATCTHAGCLVDKVDAGQIICPCHGSRFSISDGTVEQGPALLPLPAEKINVSPDGAISRG